jgi:hypothetical protein
LTVKLFVATLFFAALTSASFAGGIGEGFRIGVGIASTDVNAAGSETLRSGSGGRTELAGRRATTSVSESTSIPHLFLEKTFSNGFTIGYDYIPGAADVSAKKSRADDDAETAGGNSAAAEVEDHMTIYALMPMGSSPFYIKAGISSMDVITTEKLNTGSTYGNASVNGVTAGIGAHLERDSGWFARLEYNIAEYEDISITSDGSNVVTADLDTSETRLSVGKTF